MLTNLSKKLFLIFLVVFTSAAGAFSQSGTRVEAQGTDSILFYNNNVKTAALSNTGSFRLGATETFQATALFQLNSASQGFLAPRMTTTDRGNIVAPATGLLIYNTTTNQFDYYDGAAWLSVFSSATGNDGDWTVSGADMYSGVSGNVGIGTVTPATNLHISNNTTEVSQITENTTTSGSSLLQLKTAGGQYEYLELYKGGSSASGTIDGIPLAGLSYLSAGANASSLMLRTVTNSPIYFLTNNTEYMRITGDGNVGIGTPSPSTPLAILGNGGLQPVGITQNSVGATATMELTTQDGAGNQATRLMLGGNGNTPDAVFYSGASGSETATVHIEGTNGRVGIGITNPSYELDIHGTTGDQILNMESGDAALNTMAGARFSMGNGAIGTQYYAYAEKTDNTVNATASDFVMRKDFSTAGGYLKFFRYENSSQDIIFNDTKTTAAAFGDVLIANGNLGIGTPSPSEKLDVVGNVNYSNALKVNGSFGTASYLLTSQAGGVNTWTDPATLSTGDGIYTGSGTLSTSSLVTHADNDVVFLLSGTGLAQFQVRGMSGFNALDVQSDGDIDLDLGTFFVDASSNNVGIGTTLPSTPLAILGNGGAQPVGITQNAVGGTATMELTTQDGAGNQATRLMFGGNGNTPDAVFYSGASGSETATVHIEGTNGRVGIGITNPSYELDIHGTTGDQILNMESGDAALNTMAGARFSMGNGAIGTQYYAYAEKTDNTVNATASDFVMRKDFSTAGGYLKFFRYENSSQDIIFNDSKTTATAFGDVLIANGNVGIGTSSPSVTLDVTGSANILSGSADPLVVRSSTDGFALRVKESDNGNDAVSIFGYGTRGRITMNSNGVTNINFDADGTLDSYINAGNVGIGTTTPGTLLDIEVPASNSANGGLDINNADATGTYDPRIRFQVNGANTFSMGVDNNTNDNFTIASSGNLGGTPRFAITTGGNVGIGTTAPAYKLDVSGEARIGYHGSPDTIPLVPSDFLIVFGESAMHQFGEYWGIGPIQGQGSQHFMAQIPIPVGYKARKVVIKTYRADGNYSGNPHDCYIWNMKNQISQTGAPPFATASVTGDGIAIATFSEIVAHGNAYVGIEVRDIPELPGFPGGNAQEMITGGYVLIQQIVP